MRIRGNGWSATLALVTMAVGGCGPPPKRVPLPVPVGTLNGSRPAMANGVHLGLEFGDGVWGQEQERVELLGFAFGFSLRSRLEATVTLHDPTGNWEGADEDGSSTTAIAAKLRVLDAAAGRLSLGARAAAAFSGRDRGSVQDERLFALDLALPLQLRLTEAEGGGDGTYAYLAPRLIHEAFTDRRLKTVSLSGSRARTSGTAWGGTFGLGARAGRLVLAGEMNLVRTPSLSLDSTDFRGGWILLPSASIRVILGKDR